MIKDGEQIMKDKRFLLILILLMLLALVSCEESVVPQEAEITVENEEPSEGGTINISSVEPGSLNPLL
ncbi:MAG TPA: hypothetical protein PLL37_02785, partial [Bacillota bacterium]|nr:hypothetical protein [Bacillota bacterium]